MIHSFHKVQYSINCYLGREHKRLYGQGSRKHKHPEHDLDCVLNQQTIPPSRSLCAGAAKPSLEARRWS